MSSSGLKVIAFAWKEVPDKNAALSKDLIFTGLAGLVDPPRPEVQEAISECKSAGIKIVMITGDHPATAKNIGLQLGLISSDNEEAIHGNNMKDYESLSNAEKTLWKNTSIFARVSPKQKLDLVKVLQEDKNVVAMTGDGVNDTPALKKADIGIAMGLRGTQVAQEVADMVLNDDSFSSIVLAIKQGRAIFDNIRKFVIFLLSCNLSELLVIATASVLNLRFQLFPLQILFINLVTDVLPALALGVTPAASHIMERKPFNANEAIIDKQRWKAIAIYSFVIAICTIGAVLASHEILHNHERWNSELCNNILFYTLIFSQILHVLNMSFEKGVAFYRTEVFQNRYVWYAIVACAGIALISFWLPAFRNALKITMYGWKDWSIILSFSFLSLLLIQLVKKLKLCF